MSYPMSHEPPPATPRQRPATVTAAVWLLLLVAVLYLIGAAATLSQIPTFNEVFEEAYAGTDLEGQEGVGTISAVGVSGLNVLFAIALIVLAILDGKGKNPARIVTWVVGGIVLCCNGLGLALSGAIGGMQFDSGGENMPDPNEVQRSLEAAQPDWFATVTWIAGLGGVVALIVALILLALPPANAFFRKLPPAEPPPPPYPQG